MMIEDWEIGIDEAFRFMVGIEDRLSDKYCSFEHIKSVLLIPLLESFQHILINRTVYDALDSVDISGLYGRDPIYTDIYNKVDNHDLFRYKEKSKDHLGEISSLAYAAYIGISYFCSKDASVDLITQELALLKNVTVITMDSVFLCARLYHNQQGSMAEYKLDLKSMYKKYCSDVIKRKQLPHTLNKYVEMCLDQCIYLCITIKMEGELAGQAITFSIGIGKGTQAKHQLKE